MSGTVNRRNSHPKNEVSKKTSDIVVKSRLKILLVEYCKFGNFRENFISANSVQRHICALKQFRLGHDLLISVNDRGMSPFCEGFIFTQLRICEVLRK